MSNITELKRRLEHAKKWLDEGDGLIISLQAEIETLEKSAPPDKETVEFELIGNPWSRGIKLKNGLGFILNRWQSDPLQSECEKAVHKLATQANAAHNAPKPPLGRWGQETPMDFLKRLCKWLAHEYDPWYANRGKVDDGRDD